MKTIPKRILLLTVLSFCNFLFFTLNTTAQGVGINSTGVAPNSSALLDLQATDKGFLITRVDTTNIAYPAFGLMTLSPIDSCLYMFSGIVWSSIGGVGNNCSCVSQDSPQPPTFPCDGTVIPIVPIINPATGKTWMDRNLGASQVASSSADEDAYGDLYQWGRCSDGHEKRSSVTTTTLSTTETPGHSDFILAPDSPNDWRSPQNNNLWQGVNGTNNPCPTGWRIPTETEWDEERASWTSNDAAGAFATPLKLVVSGSRSHSNGNIGNDGSRGFYWSSTISGTFARYHYFITDGVAGMSNNRRAAGYVVRCIKD